MAHSNTKSSLFDQLSASSFIKRSNMTGYTLDAGQYLPKKFRKPFVNHNTALYVGVYTLQNAPHLTTETVIVELGPETISPHPIIVFLYINKATVGPLRSSTLDDFVE